MTDIPVLTLAGVFGLCIGSFLNVCIYRLPLGLSLVHPPSRCSACAYQLRWYDNVPVVSWLMLGGTCRRCGTAISAQYPVVEATTALLFVAIAWLTPLEPLLASRLILACILVVLFGIDLEHQILPNVITLPGIAIGFAFSFVAPPGWLASLIGIVLGAGILYGIAAAYHAVRREEGLGMGDVKMLAMIGAFLGWKAVLLTLFLGSFSGALLGLSLVALQQGTMRRALPFGTFLALGAVAAMLVGDPLIVWYTGFF